MGKEKLTPEQIKRGLEFLRAWCDEHPNSTGFVLVTGCAEDFGDNSQQKLAWSPAAIVGELERRKEDDDWGYQDIPEMILESVVE